MKIMIVDDEVIIRTGLEKVIKWGDIGLKLLPLASSAEEVLERIEIERPDILMTDIRMSGKTGLELAKEAKELLPNLEIIILTGYDDFLYTQQAIRQQVSDYLLKTSRPEEIIRTVLKAKQRVEERSLTQSKEDIKNREYRYRLLERYIIEGEALQFEVKDLIHHIEQDYSLPWQIIVLSAEGWGTSTNEQELLLFSVDNMITDLVPCISFVHKDNIIVAIPTSLDLVKEKNRRRIILDKISRLLKCQLFMAVGKLVEQPDQWHTSYLSAMMTKDYQLMLELNHLEYADIKHRKGGSMVCSYHEEMALSLKLLEDDPLALKLWLQNYIASLLKDPEVTPKSFESAIQSIIIAAHRWLDRVLSAIGFGHMPQGIAIPSLQYKLDRNPTETLFQHLHMIMKLYHHYYAEGKHIQKAMIYIEEQIGNDLRLQQVADFVHLHPNHLSEIFKKELGMKFVDYVTEKKINKAAEILTTTPAKISDVANRVGYEDVKYFGQIFKKYTGITPSEYREKNRKA